MEAWTDHPIHRGAHPLNVGPALAQITIDYCAVEDNPLTEASFRPGGAFGFGGTPTQGRFELEDYALQASDVEIDNKVLLWKKIDGIWNI